MYVYTYTNIHQIDLTEFYLSIHINRLLDIQNIFNITKKITPVQKENFKRLLFVSTSTVHKYHEYI